MIKLSFKFLFYVLSVCLLLLNTGCSSSEEKAHVQYEAAFQTEQSGREVVAEDLYRRLIRKYPATPAADQARTQLENLQKRRQHAVKQQAREILESLQLIVDGYHSVFKRWPESADDFDHQEYMFDSDYMAESVREGFTVYLALSAKEGFSLWNLPKDGDLCYRLNSRERSMVEVARKDALAEIEAAYRAVSKKGSLVFLVPRI